MMTLAGPSRSVQQAGGPTRNSHSRRIADLWRLPSVQIFCARRRRCARRSPQFNTRTERFERSLPRNRLRTSHSGGGKWFQEDRLQSVDFRQSSQTARFRRECCACQVLTETHRLKSVLLKPRTEACATFTSNFPLLFFAATREDIRATPASRRWARSCASRGLWLRPPSDHPFLRLVRVTR